LEKLLRREAERRHRLEQRSASVDAARREQAQINQGDGRRGARGGKVLVDSQGRSVYLFEADTGPKSTCFGACAAEWPPVTTDGEPSAGNGLTASMLGTTKRPDGKTQVTYNGQPLYLFEADKQPGDATGQNVDAFGAEWYVLSPTGNKVEGKATSSGGGYAY
jgi:predicted lipoprotein with Yx(FWY)xxD motif